MIAAIIAIVALAGVDHLLKWWMTGLLAEGPIVLIPKVVQLRYLENDGMAFGLLGGKQTILIVFTTLLMAFLCYYLTKVTAKSQRIAIIMIIAGGLGNLVDRIFAGYVVDYIEPLFVNFAVFNFADILVNVGCAIFLISFLFFEGKNKKTEKVGE